MELITVKTTDVYEDYNNPRTDFSGVEDMAKTFISNPIRPNEPLNPPVLVRDGGIYRIVDGACRYRAMKSLGVKEFMACVCDDMDDASTALAMLATNAKKQLSEVEISRGVQMALLTGVPVDDVEKVTGRKNLRRVKKVINNADQLITENLTLPHLAAVDELEGYPDLQEELLNTSEKEWKWKYQELFTVATRRGWFDELKPALEERGIEYHTNEWKPIDEGYQFVKSYSSADEVRDRIFRTGPAPTLRFHISSGLAFCMEYTRAEDEEVDPELEALKVKADLMESKVDGLCSDMWDFVMQKQGWHSINAAARYVINVLDDRCSTVTRNSDSARTWETDLAIDYKNRPLANANGFFAVVIYRFFVTENKLPAGTIERVLGIGDEPNQYVKKMLDHFVEIYDAAIKDGYEAPADLIEIVETVRTFIERNE